MSSHYKTIDGVRCKRALLELAEKYAQKGNKITKVQAMNLWETASGGHGLTDPDRDAITFVLEKFALRDTAKAYLESKLKDQPYTPPPSYRKSINGIPYKRELLELAEKLAEEEEKGFLNYDDALTLWGKANDGKGVTELEKLTLKYIGQEFTLKEGAREFLEEMLGVQIRQSITDGPAPGRLKLLWQRFGGFFTGRTDDDQLALEDDQDAPIPEAEQQKRVHEENTSSGSHGPSRAPKAKRQKRTHDENAPNASPEDSIAPALRALLD